MSKRPGIAAAHRGCALPLEGDSLSWSPEQRRRETAERLLNKLSQPDRRTVVEHRADQPWRSPVRVRRAPT
jgi:hypothetical protein